MSIGQTLSFILRHPLNRNRSVAAMVDFLRWQMASRILPGTFVYEWVNGVRFFVKNGETGLTGNMYTGLHEFADMGFLMHFLRRGDLFVDVGANAGAYTLLAGAALKANVMAFEPVPQTFERLLENVRLNRLESHVQCFNQAIGAHSGRIAFTHDLDTTNRAIAPHESCENAIEVEVVPLDMALRDVTPALIKIDVEGYEGAVIEGAAQTLTKPELGAVILELNESGSRYGEWQVLEKLHACGFRPHAYNPLTRMLRPLEGENEMAGNVLFVRGRAQIEAKLKTAPTVSVFGRKF
ncbi:MAG: FkbM family methyltransferase [Pseudanabaenaceae cyanobacterium]